jgi:hypothetical protein
VHEYREGIENVLGFIIEKPEDWEVETISSARGLLSLLKDFDFSFMLKKYFLQIFHPLTLFSKSYKVTDLI